MNSMIHDYWNMSPLAAVGAIILMCCVLGKWEGWMKTAGYVAGGALLLIGIADFLGSL
ncbi:MAG: hypothetical protein MJ058_08375 [Akkermansia sp.]|nr:hypothetical protein [Akkermansia sp.]